jgi:hypothetical protein
VALGRNEQMRIGSTPFWNHHGERPPAIAAV